MNLFDFTYCGNYNRQIQNLARISPEKWSFGQSGDNGILKGYLENTFRRLYGREIPDGSWSGEIQMNDAVCQLYYGKGILGKLLCAILKLLLKISDWKGKPNLNVLFNYNMPIRGYAKMTGGIVTMKMAEALTEMANGHRIKGTAHLIKAAINRE